MPLLQHEVPHGVVPAAQQQLLPALLQVPLQQLAPQAWVPAGQAQREVEASAHATPGKQHVSPQGVEPGPTLASHAC